jgi:hypothetical protein
VRPLHAAWSLSFTLNLALLLDFGRPGSGLQGCWRRAEVAPESPDGVRRGLCRWPDFGAAWARAGGVCERHGAEASEQRVYINIACAVANHRCRSVKCEPGACVCALCPQYRRVSRNHTYMCMNLCEALLTVNSASSCQTPACADNMLRKPHGQYANNRADHAHARTIQPLYNM